MDADREYTPGEIAFHAESIRGVPGGVDADVLIDELYLGAVAAFLLGRHYAQGVWWTAANQDALLLYRARGDRNFSEAVEHLAGDMLRASWLDRFFHGAHPGLPDPRNEMLDLMGPLEELSMSATIDCNFVVQAYRDTPREDRPGLLERLADTSRRERRATRQKD
ncbi:hypothetical protein AB4Y72_16535 [Arthrobacter sp. YAF34]|uniref:hypothetical protein n=1 Tax=Arthrobacter sp. YAF34 TaxID=3233083 RepID=UPI003F905088